MSLIELMRLMATAKTDDKKAIIRESLASLESPEKVPTPNKKSTSVALLAARHNHIFETEKVSRLFPPPIFILVIPFDAADFNRSFVYIEVANEKTNECTA